MGGIEAQGRLNFRVTLIKSARARGGPIYYASVIVAAAAGQPILSLARARV